MERERKRIELSQKGVKRGIKKEWYRERERGEREEYDRIMRGIPNWFTKITDLMNVFPDSIIPSSNTYHIVLVFSSSSSPPFPLSLLTSLLSYYIIILRWGQEVGVCLYGVNMFSLFPLVSPHLMISTSLLSSLVTLCFMKALSTLLFTLYLHVHVSLLLVIMRRGWERARKSEEEAWWETWMRYWCSPSSSTFPFHLVPPPLLLSLVLRGDVVLRREYSSPLRIQAKFGLLF